MKQPRSYGVVKFAGAPCRIRTYDALIRSQVLYPAEVRALKTACLFKHSTVWVSTITLKTATECSRCAISAPLSHSRRSCVVPAFRPLCTRAALTPRPRRARVALALHPRRPHVAPTPPPAPPPAPPPRRSCVAPALRSQRHEPITFRNVRDADKKGTSRRKSQKSYSWHNRA